jgi:predicted DsbA family dithiol-disulfide isomerase
MTPLEIYADPICPWCYIGKVALTRAMEARPDHGLAVSWKPFQLNPDMPPDGMDRQEYLSLKFGDGLMDAYRPVVERAEALGLDLNLPAITRQPNTLAAHALVHWAGLEGKQNAAVDGLFRAYFHDGRDIGARDVLLDIATRAGMDAALTARLLDSGADRDTIAAADRDARARGITGVPFFIVAGQHAVPGAQATELWVQVIDELAGRAPGDAG